MLLFKSFYIKKVSCSYWSESSVLILIGSLILLFFINPDASAQGNLLITPRRLVFEGPKRSFDLNLANTGQDSATYAISLVQIRMKVEGGFETITRPDSGQRFADGHIRFFPRLVTLGPNEAQVVKVQLVKTNELTEGEYRSHFYFRSVPKQKPLGEDDIVEDSTTISVKLTPIFGITIPVIIRAGETTAKVTLSELALQIVNDTVSRLNITFIRTGNISVYGNLIIDYISPQGKTTRVGSANGVAVYTPNTIRKFQLNLNRLPAVDFRKGTLHITYSATSDVKPVLYAERELQLR